MFIENEEGRNRQIIEDSELAIINGLEKASREVALGNILSRFDLNYYKTLARIWGFPEANITIHLFIGGFEELVNQKITEEKSHLKKFFKSPK